MNKSLVLIKPIKKAKITYLTAIRKKFESRGDFLNYCTNKEIDTGLCYYFQKQHIENYENILDLMTTHSEGNKTEKEYWYPTACNLSTKYLGYSVDIILKIKKEALSPRLNLLKKIQFNLIKNN